MVKVSEANEEVVEVNEGRSWISSVNQKNVSCGQNEGCEGQRKVFRNWVEWCKSSGEESGGQREGCGDWGKDYQGVGCGGMKGGKKIENKTVELKKRGCEDRGHWGWWEGCEGWEGGNGGWKGRICKFEETALDIKEEVSFVKKEILKVKKKS